MSGATSSASKLANAEHGLSHSFAQCYENFTTVTYSCKLSRLCYKTFLQPYFTPSEPSNSVNTCVKSRHWQLLNITAVTKAL